uniref:Uncharacterized protein n=1 Tax=viral metagenome TaxID=1070528 RepID=A0A6M3IXE3_9ZZZZ
MQPVIYSPDGAKVLTTLDELRAFLDAQSEPPVPETHALSIGTNPSPIADYMPNVFCDAMKHARPWESYTVTGSKDPRPLALDANGWPMKLEEGQAARTAMFIGQDGNYRGGEYWIAAAQGTGKVRIKNGSSTSIRTLHNGLLVEGSVYAAIDPDLGGVLLDIMETDPENPLRNIKIVHEADLHNTSTFTDEFLDSLSAYHGPLRFMDWQRINSSEEVEWSDRPKVTDCNYTRGVPLEIIIEPANITGKDLWICVPHLATDDYVANMVQMLAQDVEHGQNVYIEYSNETWNSIFKQATYVQDQGVAQGLSTSRFDAGRFFHAWRTQEVARIARRVWADNGGSGEIRPVLCGQAPSASWTDRMMVEMNLGGENCPYAIGIAPYFGGRIGTRGYAQSLAGVSLETALDSLFAKIINEDMPDIITWLNAQSEVARKWGLPLVAYEGGQHLVGIYSAMNNADLNALFDAAQHDPRMKDCYNMLFKAWRDAGGGIFCHYAHCSPMRQHGRWGAIEYYGQADTPKLVAIKEIQGTEK